ncbi:MAG: type II toxin-antitoxin system RelE/ParE family toxin [Gammaproteobacteria bacterium]|nr:type II toxin-antitoxin system RelE/ParE family toxin [Gammaproteobacteria bacterium]
MNYQLIYTESYNKRAKKFLQNQPHLIEIYKKTLKFLELNPYHPSLRLHRLKGKLQDLYSVSINISYRITFEFLIQEKNILLVNVGDHSFVY